MAILAILSATVIYSSPKNSSWYLLLSSITRWLDFRNLWASLWIVFEDGSLNYTLLLKEPGQYVNKIKIFGGLYSPNICLLNHHGSIGLELSKWMHTSLMTLLANLSKRFLWMQVLTLQISSNLTHHLCYLYLLKRVFWSPFVSTNIQ